MADQLDAEVFIRMRPDFVGIFRNAPNFQFVVNGQLPHDVQRHREVRRAREQAFTIVWLYGIFPLPAVNWRLLWQRHRPENWRYALVNMFSTIALIMVRIGRLVAYMILTGNWIRDIVRFVTMFGSMVTYSDNFFQDILTYALRNYPQIVQRKYELQLLQAPDNDSLGQFLIDTLAWNIRANCVRPKGDIQGNCTLHVESLIFRFSRALVQVLPIFNMVPEVFLTASTIALYLTYGLIGQFLGFNVIFFLLLHSFHRWMKLFGFMGLFLKTIWHSTETLVF